jgi:hypothetical protein
VGNLLGRADVTVLADARVHDDRLPAADR